MISEPKGQPAAVDASADPYRYWAFISYSQRDGKWANWLFRALETYSIPKKLGAQGTEQAAIPKRLFPVFRDRDELAGASDLGAKLTDALRQSRALIVICSPNAARSRWVNEEIKSYKALGREDRVLALIVDGEPNASDDPARAAEECFPEAMRFRVDPERGLTPVRVEPIGADVRPEKDGKRNALLKLVAAVLNVGLDALKQREQERRMRRLMVTGGVLALLVVVFAGLAWYANVQRRLAEERLRLTRARQLAVQSAAALTRGGEGLEVGTLLALESLGSAWTPDMHDLLLQLDALLPGPPQKRWKAHERFGIRNLLVHRPRGWLVTDSDDEEAIWNLADGSLIHRIPTPKSGSANRPDVSPDGRWLAGQCERDVCVWETATWKQVARLPGGQTGTKIGFSGDSRWLGVSGYGSSQVELYGTSGWAKAAAIDHGEQISGLAFSPEPGVLATSGSSRLTLWDAAGGKRLGETHADASRMLVFSPDGTRLASGQVKTKLDSSLTPRADGVEIQLWDVRRDAAGDIEPNLIRTLRGEARESSLGISGELAFSPDGRYLTTTGSVLDTESGQEVALSPPHGQTAAVFGGVGVGERAWILGDDSGAVEVRAFDVKEAFRLPGGAAPQAVDFSPEGKWLAVGNEDGTVRVFAVDGWRAVARFHHPQPVPTLAFSPDGKHLAVVGESIAFGLAAADWKPRCRIDREDAIESWGFSPDGRVLVTSTGSALGLSPLEGGASHILSHAGAVEPAVTFSPDGSRLWTATKTQYDRRVGIAKPAESYLWEVGSGKRLAAVEKSGETAAADRRTVELQEHPHAVPAKGPWREARTLQGEDLFTREVALVTRVLGAPPLDQAVSPDGRWLATAGADGTLRLWPLRPEDLARTVCSRLERNLTAKEWSELHVDDGPRRRTCPRLP